MLSGLSGHGTAIMDFLVAPISWPGTLTTLIIIHKECTQHLTKETQLGSSGNGGAGPSLGSSQRSCFGCKLPAMRSHLAAAVLTAKLSGKEMTRRCMNAQRF